MQTEERGATTIIVARFPALATVTDGVPGRGGSAARRRPCIRTGSERHVPAGVPRHQRNWPAAPGTRVLEPPSLLICGGPPHDTAYWSGARISVHFAAPGDRGAPRATGRNVAKAEHRQPVGRRRSPSRFAADAGGVGAFSRRVHAARAGTRIIQVRRPVARGKGGGRSRWPASSPTAGLTSALPSSEAGRRRSARRSTFRPGSRDRPS